MSCISASLGASEIGLLKRIEKPANGMAVQYIERISHDAEKGTEQFLSYLRSETPRYTVIKESYNACKATTKTEKIDDGDAAEKSFKEVDARFEKEFVTRVISAALSKLKLIDYNGCKGYLETFGHPALWRAFQYHKATGCYKVTEGSVLYLRMPRGIRHEPIMSTYRGPAARALFLRAQDHYNRCSLREIGKLIMMQVASQTVYKELVQRKAIESDNDRKVFSCLYNTYLKEDSSYQLQQHRVLMADEQNEDMIIFSEQSEPIGAGEQAKVKFEEAEKRFKRQED